MIPNLIPSYIPGVAVGDDRPIREVINERIRLNLQAIDNFNEVIEKKRQENFELEEAMKELDEHPFLEKITNLLRRIRG